jgi:transposase-like protein
MTLLSVCCPQCKNDQVGKRGKTSNEKQRYLCQNEVCPQQTFVLEYRHRGRLPQVKRQIIDMALNGSGIRDTARVLGISKETVLSELKKRKECSSRSTRRCLGA